MLSLMQASGEVGKWSEALKLPEGEDRLCQVRDATIQWPFLAQVRNVDTGLSSNLTASIRCRSHETEEMGRLETEDSKSGSQTPNNFSVASHTDSERVRGTSA